MSWKHLAGLAVAALLALGCGLSHVCGGNEHVQQSVIQLASTIAAGVLGNAMRTEAPKTP